MKFCQRQPSVWEESFTWVMDFSGYEKKKNKAEEKLMFCDVSGKKDGLNSAFEKKYTVPNSDAYQTFSVFA